MDVETWREWKRPDQLHVRVRLDDGTEHTRELDPIRNDRDARDLRIAAGFWEHGQRVAARLGGLGAIGAAAASAAVLTDQCLAIEQLFPHLRDRLPA